jgi:hypothetical protein
VQTLPVYVWERYRGAEFDPVLELHTVLPVCRATNLVFWWLVLAYAMRLGRTFGGAWGGRIAVALVACDPNFLGHAALATTDIALLACMLALVYHTHHCYTPGASWRRRVLVPGLLYGVAITAKASAMVFGAQALFVLGLWNLRGRRRADAPAGKLGVAEGRAHLARDVPVPQDLVAMALVGFVWVFGYCGCDWGTEPTFIKWADGLPDGDLKRAMVPVSRELRIFTNAGEALLHQIKHNVRGHGTYLLGEWHPRATPAYFPLALSMKVPLPAIILLLAALGRAPAPAPPADGRRCAGAARVHPELPGADRHPVRVPAHGADVHHDRGGDRPRVGRASSRGAGRPAVAGRAAAGALGGNGGVGVAARAELLQPALGRAGRGERAAARLELRLGQGLPELRRWNAEHNGGEPLGVWYFGTDPDIVHPPLVWLHLSHVPLTGPDDVSGHCPTKLLAVSVALLSNNPAPTPPHRARLEWVRAQAPVARTTHFVIYRTASSGGLCYRTARAAYHSRAATGPASLEPVNRPCGVLQRNSASATCDHNGPPSRADVSAGSCICRGRSSVRRASRCGGSCGRSFAAVGLIGSVAGFLLFAALAVGVWWAKAEASRRADALAGRAHAAADTADHAVGFVRGVVTRRRRTSPGPGRPRPSRRSRSTRSCRSARSRRRRSWPGRSIGRTPRWRPRRTRWWWRTPRWSCSTRTSSCRGGSGCGRRRWPTPGPSCRPPPAT